MDEIKDLVRYVEQPLKLDDLQEIGRHAIGIAQQLKIGSKEVADTASQDKNHLDSKIKEAEERIKPFKQKAKALHTYFCDMEKTVLDPLKEAKEITNGKIVEFDLEKQRKLAEIQAELDDIARLEAAEKAQENGNTGLSEAILDGHVPVYAAPQEKSKIKGTDIAQNWTYEIMNLGEFINKADDRFIKKEPNKQMLRAEATSKKERASVPGVRFYPKHTAKKARTDMTKRPF
jgi:hypothetical protein